MLFGESILRYDKIHIDDSLVFFPYSDTEIEVDTYDYSETQILSIYFGYETIVDDYYSENLAMFQSLGLDNLFNNYYISRYLPKVNIYIDNYMAIQNEIISISELPLVEKIYISEYGMYNIIDEYFDDSIVIEPVEGGGGEGSCNISTDNDDKIRVGIVDSGNINRLYNDFLCDVVLVEEFPDGDTRYHITTVADVIVQKFEDLNDLALYTTNASTGDLVDLLPRLEYLLDNDVHIINLSIGTAFRDDVGVYHSLSQDIDSLIYMYNVPIVAAAGQMSASLELEWGGIKYVVQPAIGFNVIAVGAVNSDNTLWSISSMVELLNISKPNLVASKYSMGTSVGTSYASPRVVAAIANLLYVNETTYNVNYLMSILHNSADETIPDYFSGTRGFDDGRGAGILDENKLFSYNSSAITKTISCSSIPNQTCGTQNFSTYIGEYAEISVSYLLDPQFINLSTILNVNPLNVYKIKVVDNTHNITYILTLDTNYGIIRAPSQLTDYTVSIEYVSGTYPFIPNMVLVINTDLEPVH